MKDFILSTKRFVPEAPTEWRKVRCFREGLKSCSPHAHTSEPLRKVQTSILSFRLQTLIKKILHSHWAQMFQYSVAWSAMTKPRSLESVLADTPTLSVSRQPHQHMKRKCERRPRAVEPERPPTGKPYYVRLLLASQTWITERGLY